MKCPACQTQNPHDAYFCGGCGKRLRARVGDESDDEADYDFGSMHTVDTGLTKGAGPQQTLLPVGSVFADRYEILAVVGQGGMGVVYRATDRVTAKDVALKLIRADRLAGKDAVKRLINEGVTSRDIRHPNVVAVYDVGETGGQPYMSMEMLEGRSLRAWNQKRMVANVDTSMKTAGVIINEILSGLEAAHKAGVVHRDLKPENVILLSDPSDDGVQLKILDFGIARVAGAGDTGSTSLGTAEYMAPEQITAPDAAQPSADLFSLSVMFYELLVGVVPKGHWQPPSGGRADVPVGVDKLIERGLSNNPRARPRNVDEYRTILAEAVRLGPEWKPDNNDRDDPIPKPDPVTPEPGPVKPKFDITKIDRRWWMGAAAAVGLLAIGQGVTQMMGGGGGYGPEPAPYDDEDIDGGDDETIDPNPQPDPGPDIEPGPQPQPDPPPRPQGIRYQNFSGYWADDFGGVWAVSVTPSGALQGQASSGPSTGLVAQGQFNGSEFAFQLINYGSITGYGAGVYDGGCHINYPTTDAYGNAIRAQFHINHPAGAPCP